MPVEAVSGKRSATNGERRKHIKQQPGGTKGRRDDWRLELGAEGIRQGRPQEHGREATQRRPQDALRTLSASAGSERRSLHVLDDQARGARVQEAAQGAANAAGVANLKQTWDDLEPKGDFDLVPHCKLAKVYDPALSQLELVISVAQHRERIRGALGQTGANRLLGQALSGASERALSAAVQQN